MQTWSAGEFVKVFLVIIFISPIRIMFITSRGARDTNTVIINASEIIRELLDVANRVWQ